MARYAQRSPAFVRKTSSIRARRAVRRLAAENLERRLLLTTVTAVDPLANATDAAAGVISATFDQDVVAGTATAENFVAHGSVSRGQLVGGATAVAAAGPVISHTPTGSFAAGELVQVTVTSNIATNGGAANPRVWQFRTAAGGSGEFTDSGQDLPALGTQFVTLGDVDGDGDLDAVEGGVGAVLLNDGTGIFTDSGQGLTPGGDLELGDIDGDGDLDIVGTTEVWSNDGNGIFTNSNQALGGGITVALGDVDGDGDLDAMVGVAYTSNRVFLNDGNGTFTNNGQTNLGTASPQSIEFADLDSDGDLDAFAANNGPADQVFLNDGSGIFTDSGQAMGGFQTSQDVELGDFDGDGDVDAFIGNETGPNRVWLNDGSGVFTNSGQAIGNHRTFGISIGDLDGDGDLDAFESNSWALNIAQQDSRIWLNDGAGNFGDSGQRFAPFFNYASEVGDLDGDGDLDVWMATNSQPSRVLFNRNLVPSVSLTTDATEIGEASGVATVTATLSAAHTAEVTVDLGFSGSAAATDDYTASGSQITIAVGDTTGSIMVTAVQDAIDEPDETVVVDIVGATNAQEAGAQQVTVTIQDDDEPIPVPDVSLSVDNASIPEAEGTATFTVTLSEVTTVPVTVDLTISGTASASDFTASGTQVVVAAGATSGSITVTAVQDTVDEPAESVVVEISAVSGGNELGTQQATTTIVDDDEAPVPDVTLTADPQEIAEAAGVATLTVTLSEVTTVPVTIDLEMTGTAAATDFTASATQVVVAAGLTSGSVTVTAIQDDVNEPNETVIVDIASVNGGNEVGDQQQVITIVDDDVPPSFAVTSLGATASGFQVDFTNELDASEVNLYDTLNAGLGAADVIVSGAASGSVAGSIVVGASSLTFIKSGNPLAPDSYTVTLRSGEDGFKDTGAMLLDGNGDGTPGDDYVGTFTIEAAPEGARMVSIPDFVRGAGQGVNLPADSTTGIPITISEGENVRAADIRIGYDPALLEITGATAPAGGSVIVNTTTTPGVAILVFFSSASLPAGSGTFIELQATVPTADASANYGNHQVLDLHSVTIGDGNDNEFSVIVDDAAHFATYFADVSGNGRINASDAAQVARFAALIDSGFAASLNVDPVLVGDISGNGRINAADASRVAQFAALIDVPEIPPVPRGILTAANAGSARHLALAPAEASGTPRLAVAETSGEKLLPTPGKSEFHVERNFSSETLPAAVDESVDQSIAAMAGNGSKLDPSWATLEDVLDELFSTGE